MERKVIAYTVIEKKSIDDLSKEVIRLSNDGWQLGGGVSVRPSGSGLVSVYAQSMVKFAVG